jgi:NAD(P)H-hydrate repair Nnr-like enzyme with NAD(P)H-hydrate epimerase domain
VYINGEEVARSNVPLGEAGYRTLAVSAVVNADELAFIDFAISPRLYRGPNVVAVEVHQQSLNSSDLIFDLALLGTGNAGPLPEPPRPPVSTINTGAEASAPALRIRP